MPRLQVRVSLFLSLATKLTKRLAAFALLSVLVMYPVCGFAQDAGTGTPAFNSFSHARGGIDVINLGNLNVHLDIPMQSLGAYGPEASTKLVMDSLIIMTSGAFSSPYPPLTVSDSTFVAFRTGRSGTSCADYESTTTGVFDQRNTYHTTTTLYLDGCNHAFSVTAPGADGWAIGGTTGATGRATLYAIAPNGDVYGNGITDPHGNTVAWISHTLTDALGNAVVTFTNGNNVATYTYPGPNSTTSTYSLNYTTYQAVQPAFNCPGMLPPPGYPTRLITS